MAFAYKLGIPKLTPVSTLPWFPDDSDYSTWPRIPGTDDPVLRFRWDRGWDDNDNFYAIWMIVSHMKHHGASLVADSVDALKAISEEDHQKRVVKKFNDIQRGMCEAGILNSKNCRTVALVPATHVQGRDNDDEPASVPIVTTAGLERTEAQEKRLKAANLASRAKGVRCHVINNSSICLIDRY